MIFYDPSSGDGLTRPIKYLPRHGFLITMLGGKIPGQVTEIRDCISEISDAFDYKVIDANERVTGKDFLIKIWKFIYSSPLAIAVIQEDISHHTLMNIFYELGVAQAMGKETLVVKCQGSDIPSDLIRTEYIEFNNTFKDKFSKFFDEILERAEYYEIMGDQHENNPVMSLDYYRRAYLLTGEQKLRKKAAELIEKHGLSGRAKNSVERVLAKF